MMSPSPSILKKQLHAVVRSGRPCREWLYANYYAHIRDDVLMALATFKQCRAMGLTVPTLNIDNVVLLIRAMQIRERSGMSPQSCTDGAREWWAWRKSGSCSAFHTLEAFCLVYLVGSIMCEDHAIHPN